MKRALQSQSPADDALETRKTGVFDGPLQRVAARILDGHDFAMTITPQGIDVLVLRQDRPGQTALQPAFPGVPRDRTSRGHAKIDANGPEADSTAAHRAQNQPLPAPG